MPEINTTTAAAATAAGMVTVTGGILGMQYDALLIGFLAGIIALSFADKQTYAKMAFSVLSSSLLAGFFAPIATAAALHYLPAIASAGPEGVRLASAGAIGLAAQSMIPVCLSWLRGKVAGATANGSSQP